ncbi:MAG TPA: ABC transporter ATP-binding protein [Pseudobacteroides sp.]|uniref:ABC transporter ATP-binding protein n=1 Tax=Pseudobacteroides sp. TaxID=1968840 RepID=UPI002F94F5CC
MPKLIKAKKDSSAKRIIAFFLPYTILIAAAFMPMWIYSAYNFSFAVFQKIIINLMGTKDIEALKKLLGAVLAISIGAIAFLISGEFLKSHIQNLIVRDIKLSMFEKLNSLSMSKLNQLGSSDIFCRISYFSESIVKIILKDFYSIIYNVLVYSVAFFYLACSNVFIALAAASTGPVIFLAGHFFKKKQDKIIGQQNQLDRQVRALCHEVLTGMKEIRVFGVQKIFLDSYTDEIKLRQSLTFKLHMLFTFQSQISNIIKGGLNVVVLYFISIMAIGGKITIGEVVAFNYLFGIMHGPVLGISNSINTMRENVRNSKTVFDFMDIETLPDNKNDNKRPEKKSDMAISLSNVSLTIGSNEYKIFDKLDLNIREGEKVALVGLSGGGKSTLLKLLCGLYIPDKGEAELFGNSIKNTETARKLVAYIPQNPYVFPQTIAMNIGVGKEGTGMDEIRAAAALSGAHGFIADRENGYDTVLKENAANLSVGQKQRIAIARAFLKNSPIILADEPTAFLDKDSEEVFYKSINMQKGKTIVVAAHKLYTIKGFDRILVLEKGKIIEEGNHDELMVQNGAYKKMFLMQSNAGEEEKAKNEEKLFTA